MNEWMKRYCDIAEADSLVRSYCDVYNMISCLLTNCDYEPVRFSFTPFNVVYWSFHYDIRVFVSLLCGCAAQWCWYLLYILTSQTGTSCCVSVFVKSLSLTTVWNRNWPTLSMPAQRPWTWSTPTPRPLGY